MTPAEQVVAAAEWVVARYAAEHPPEAPAAAGIDAATVAVLTELVELLDRLRRDLFALADAHPCGGLLTRAFALRLAETLILDYARETGR